MDQLSPDVVESHREPVVNLDPDNSYNIDGTNEGNCADETASTSSSMCILSMSDVTEDIEETTQMQAQTGASSQIAPNDSTPHDIINQVVLEDTKQPQSDDPYSLMRKSQFAQVI